MRLIFLVIILFQSSLIYAQLGCPKQIVDSFGAVIRGDTCKKQIALVLTGDEFADGGDVVLKTLSAQKIKASFFLTGRFYRNKKFQSLIRRLKKAGHYLGPHSDQHLLYNDWTKRDSLLVSKDEFRNDLMSNYVAMESFGIGSKPRLHFGRNA